MKLIRSVAAVLAGFSAVVLQAPFAFADGLADCERYGVAFSKRQGGTVSRIQIEKGNSLVVNRFDEKVGSQMVATEYTGFARVTTPEATRRQRFVCLHAGDGKQAVYFVVLLD